MKDTVPRVLLAAVAVVELCCGIVLLFPYYDGSASYVHPKLAFLGAVFFIAFGGFLMAMATIGFRSLRTLILNWRLFAGKDKSNYQTKPHHTTTTL